MSSAVSPREGIQFDVVGGDEVLLSPLGAGKSASSGRGAVGQELEREERVGGAALAEVELDRVGVHVPPAVDHDEVDGEAAEHALRASAPPILTASL